MSIHIEPTTLLDVDIMVREDRTRARAVVGISYPGTYGGVRIFADLADLGRMAKLLTDAYRTLSREAAKRGVTE